MRKNLIMFFVVVVTFFFVFSYKVYAAGLTVTGDMTLKEIRISKSGHWEITE